VGTEKGRKITLSDVASIANVSKITASRAFSSPEKVHPDTLKQIQDVARKMGYVVNSSARMLRSKASKTIGIVHSDMTNPFFSSLARYINLEAQKAGYDTLVFDTCESQEIENRVIEKLIGYNVDAIILSVISLDQDYKPPYLSQLEKLSIPVILVDRELDAKWCSGVYIDNIDCGLQAGRYLLKQQVKDVVIVSGPERSNVARERIMGLSAALQGNVDKLTVLHTDFGMEMATEKIANYLNDQPLPDYFVGCNNQISLGIIKSCHAKGVMVMRDVGLLAIDEVSWSAIYGLPLPYVKHDLHEIAWQALNLAIRRIKERDSISPNVIIRSKLYAPNDD